jgi:uncharacterized protein YndB with AHSA1/START domain
MASTESIDTADREIVLVRVFDAPRALVWKAWTAREHVVQWWGPTGFTTTMHEMEVRPGGVWRYIMHGPDGTDYDNKISYLEAREPEQLIYDHGDSNNPAQFRVTVTFAEENGKTRLTMRSLFPTAEARNFVVEKFHAIEGGNQHLDKLGRHLAKMGSTGETTEQPFVITRRFDAPRALVWKAWSEPERLAQWWGPKGCTIRVKKLDFRPGGIFHYAMGMPNGADMWGRFIYREIAAPERLSWLNSFSDETGGLARAPFNPSWPLEMLVTTIFAEEGGKTLLTLRAGAHNASATERAVFAAGFASMQQGFGGTFDQLADYLKKAG